MKSRSQPNYQVQERNADDLPPLGVALVYARETGDAMDHSSNEIPTRHVRAAQSTTAQLLAPYKELTANSDLRYSCNHLWFKSMEETNLWRAGIDSFAALLLGQVTDIIYPIFQGRQDTGTRLVWISHLDGLLGLKSPVPAKVLHGNRRLREHPALLLSNPMDAGWLLEGDFDLADDAIFLIPRSDLQAWFSQEIEWLGREVEQRLSKILVPCVGETLSDGGVYVTSICNALGPASHQNLLEKVMNL